MFKMHKSSYAVIALATVAAMAISSCSNKPAESKVMARYVPERSDDFVFENNFICGRFYGQALEGNPTSPGIDIWVKTPGALVANQRYKDELENGLSYHIDRGNGKDCYKVAVSLGGGASAPIIDGALQYPATNYRSWEVLEQSPEKIVFVLHYPQWQMADSTGVSLDKKITVVADTYFCKVEDTYTSNCDSIEVAAGVFRHVAQGTIEQELQDETSYAIWEHASDQSVEPEDGMLGVAIYVPDAGRSSYTESLDHGICTRKIKSGDTFTYYFGSCWSKGDVKTAKDWFNIVKTIKNEN